MDSLNIPKSYREKIIKINRRKFVVDAVDKKEKIVYEFNGDFWHGNPERYNPNDINSVNKIKIGDLYNKTIEKTKILEEHGYKVISIWESEFNR